MRDEIKKLFAELSEIRDADLREKVIDTWADSIGNTRNRNDGGPRTTARRTDAMVPSLLQARRRCQDTLGPLLK